MKAIATLSLLGIAFTAEDDQFSLLSKLLHLKKPHKPVAQQPSLISQPSTGEEYINYPSLEDDELMLLPYYRLPTDTPIKPILPPTFPEPELPEFPGPPTKRPVFYEDIDSELFVPNGVYKKAARESVSLDLFLMEALAVVREAEERDQLVQDVLDVVRDVLTPDEVDEATLVQTTEEFVDESLEINAYFKKKEERREMDERDQLVQEVLDVVRDVLNPDEVDEVTLVHSAEEYVDDSLEINSYFKKKEERREMDERDQLVQEVLDVVREVLNPDEVDEVTLVHSAEEYVDDSLEINAYFKKKEERREMDERDQLVQEVLDVVRDVLNPDEVDEETLVHSAEEYVDDSLEINGKNKAHDNFLGHLKTVMKEKVNNFKDNVKSLFGNHGGDN